MDIYYATYGYTTISFVMDWVCYSGHTQAFPQAWTQTSMTYLPGGFGPDDGSAHSFIGFEGQSPDISINSFQYYTQVAGYWIEWFYYYAIYQRETVHQALDDASIAVFGVGYLGTPLISYTAWWPGGYMGETYYEPGYRWTGSMRIYGDSRIYVSQGSSDVVSTPSITSNVPNPGNPFTSYQFSVSSTDSNGYDVAYTIFWGDGSQTSSGFYPSGQARNFYHSYNYGYGGQYTVTVYTKSRYNSWSSPNYYSVDIQSAPLNWMSIQAYDAYMWELNPNVYVDGTWVGTAPLYIQVPQGSTISVDSSTWDPYLNYYASFQYDDTDGTSYYHAYYW